MAKLSIVDKTFDLPVAADATSSGMFHQAYTAIWLPLDAAADGKVTAILASLGFTSEQVEKMASEVLEFIDKIKRACL